MAVVNPDLGGKSGGTMEIVRYFGTYSNKIRGQTTLIPDRMIRLPEPSPNLKSQISNLIIG